MVDIDLAVLYGTETKKLKHKIKRNIKKISIGFYV
ncbi:MAG TPA: ORF6N domain-containing protein [Ignavibacteria bacterium]